MKTISLPFFGSFNCLAEKCPLNCCKYYRIGFFNWEADKFESNPLWKDVDAEGHSLKAYLDRDEFGWIVRKACRRECAFFKENLCSLQKKNGPQAQPSICRTFPRIITKFNDRLELVLDPCCPEVPNLAKDWTLCKFDITGDGELAYDEKYLKRQRALDTLADTSRPLRDCFEAMASEYSADVDIPSLELSAVREEFIRKTTALLVMAFVIPYENYPTIPNMMGYIISLMLQTAETFNKEGTSEDWWDMSVRYTSIFIDSIIEKDFDRDYEYSYIDVNDLPAIR